MVKGGNIFDWSFHQTADHARMDESATSDRWEMEMVARRLIAAREALGLTKAEFADIIGIDRSSYTKIEKGLKPLLPPTARMIFQLYGLDMNYFYLGQLGGLPSSLSSKVIAHLNGATE